MKIINSFSLLLLSAFAINTFGMEEGNTSNVPSLKDQCLEHAINSFTSLAQLKKANLPLDIKDDLINKYFMGSSPIACNAIHYMIEIVLPRNDELFCTYFIKLQKLYSILQNISFEQLVLFDDIHKAMEKNQVVYLDEQQEKIFNSFIPEIQEVLKKHVVLQEDADYHNNCNIM